MAKVGEHIAAVIKHARNTGCRLLLQTELHNAEVARYPLLLSAVNVIA